MWLTISRVVSLGLLFLAYTQLLRYLGAASYGQLQSALSLVTLFGVVIDFGIQQYIIKKISEDKTQAKRYFHNFLAIELVLAALVYGAMVSTALLLNYEPIVVKAVIFAGLGAAIHGLTYPFLAVMSAYYDLKKVAVLNMVATIINISVIFIVIYFGFSIVALTTQQIIYAVVAIVVYYQFIKKYIPSPDVIVGLRSLDYALVKKIFIAVLPFSMLVGFSTLYNRIDVLLIKQMLGNTEVGLYSAAYKLFDLMGFFPAVVSHSLYPVFATLMVQGSVAEVKVTLERYLRFMIAAALPMGVGGMVLAVPLITLLAGSNFASDAEILESARALMVLIWAPAILFIYIVVNSLVISQLTRFAVMATGVNLVINVVGNIILIPRIGIMGAAIMTLVSETIQAGIYFYLVKKKITDFKFFSYVWQPLIASLVMGAVIFQVQTMALPIVVILGAAVYGIMLLLLRFFRRDDFTFIKSLLGRGI